MYAPRAAVEEDIRMDNIGQKRKVKEFSVAVQRVVRVFRSAVFLIGSSKRRLCPAHFWNYCHAGGGCQEAVRPHFHLIGFKILALAPRLRVRL